MNLPRIKWEMDLIHHSENIPYFYFSDVLGLTASQTRNIEDTMCLPPELRHSAWEYSIEEFGIKSIEKVFLKLANILRPHAPEIKYLIKEYHLEIQFICVIEAIDGDGPEVTLGAESIAFLAELGAQLGFDLYYYPEEGEED